MNPFPASCVYGAPLPELAARPADAVQVSPLFPGSAELEAMAPESLSSVVMAAPPATLERRYALALALRALKPGGSLAAMAPSDKGGSRLGKELTAFGCQAHDTGRRHQRICVTTKGEGLTGVEDAIAAGGLQRPAALGLWSQPGVFSWDRVDPGTALLLSAVPQFSGRGADLGCGIGVIALQLLKAPSVAGLELIDIDRRAIQAAKRNVEDPRAHLQWADALAGPALEGLDFVVCNPPFHDGGSEDRALGQAFIRRAREALRPKGVLWMVANRHLPYEAVLAEAFGRVERRAESGGYKVYEARR